MNLDFQAFATKYNKNRFLSLHQTMSFEQYLQLVCNQPQLAYSAHQRLYRMIVDAGKHQIEKNKRLITRYKFFDQSDIKIFGLDRNLESFVGSIRGAAHFHGPERRLIMLCGPVGSSKSTICRRLKRGLEDYSRTDQGAIYTFHWKNIGKYNSTSDAKCPLNDDPLKLIPNDEDGIKMRKEICSIISSRLEETTPENEKNDILPIRINGDLNPQCKFYMDSLMREYDGDWMRVVNNHIEVRRILLSEVNRVGIGTFQPKDPKNQDATELTGDINYRKIAEYGVDSDPRAFSFDGEFEISNRGFLEFIEVLKLEKEFLYDLLGACQERQIKPKKFPQIDIDCVLIGHTNLPEFDKMKNDPMMEAFRDRTIRGDVPYLLEVSKEIEVLKQDFNPQKIRKHIAPHTVEIAALWDVLTRLHHDEKMQIRLVDKAKLYDGKVLPDWNDEKIKELKDKYATFEEGMKQGVSARFTQNALSNIVVSENKYVGPFMFLKEAGEKLNLMMEQDKTKIEKYRACLEYAKEELDQILKEEVENAIVGDTEILQRVFEKYIDNVVAFVQNAKIVNPMTGVDEDPDETLMSSIEEKMQIPSSQAPQYRTHIAKYMFTRTYKKKGDEEMRWDCEPKLAEAIRKKVFEDMKDTIQISKVSSITTSSNKEEQKKINDLKQRLIQTYHYNDESATDVLRYVSSLVSRGDSK